ncbi:MAG TPA: nucleotide exchange factor GrpE [Streptosporangiaceae bacterium]|jgi:molecular chaperone GrpE|nr:nucleotide exchange factor GrpE [Streptosporangiaceae bacterium]
MSSSEDSTAGPVIRDRRRIDPVTGQVRDPDQSGQAAGPAQGAQTAGPASAASAAGEAAGETVSGERRPGRHSTGFGGNDAATEEALSQLAERTADLQRLQAEYANYRKRVERDRAAVREQSLANVLAELLPVLDDIGRAREHGELSGGFKSIAESFESAVAKLGLTTYGEKGDAFDPVVHEALMHSYSDDVTEPTCVQILQPGYKIGDRILRPARVAVAEPGGSGGNAGETDDDTSGETSRKGDTSPQEVPADSNG